MPPNRTCEEFPVADLDPGAQRALLDRLFDAFNRHDVAGVCDCFTPDVVFDAAVGAEVYGTRFSGREAVAAAFSKTFADLRDVRWDDVRHYPGTDYATTTWTMRGTRPDGLRLEVEGIDLFTLRDGRVALKRAFRKERPLQKP
jgi:ketosteroid isomerase-like protein